MTFEAREKIIRRDEFAAGEAKGIATGKMKNMEAIFLNMLSHGYDVAEAIELTGISKERGEALASAK